MDKGRFLIERHLRDGTPIAQLAAANGVHRSWLYKLLARYEAEGEPGLVPRSRRPHHSPARIADLFEDEIVRLRKSLEDAGWDAGPETIHEHLAQRHREVPSASTIWRVLRARGFVTDQPHKRPRSSYVRFAAELPNECWQMDTTHVRLADGTEVEILNVIDDHSRLCVASRARRVYASTDVVAVFSGAIARFGAPAAVLSDIQAGLALGSASHPAGGTRIWVTGACPPPLLTDRSVRPCTTPRLLTTGRTGATPRRRCPIENPVAGA